MLDTEINTEESKEANGISTQVELKPTPVKPWIEAGFKSRADWRKSKKSGMSASETKAKGEKSEGDVKPKKVKKSTAKVVKVKAAAQAKPVKKAAKKPAATAKAKTKGEDSKKSPLERRAAAMRTAAFKKALAKKEEPSEKEKLVLKAFGGVGKTKTIGELGERAWPNKPKKIQKSWVRNMLRWCVVSKHVKWVDEGTYKRLK